MAVFLPQAQIQAPRNAMLDFSPINEAIDTNRRNAMLDRQFGADQEHRQAQLGMQREQLDMRRQEFDQNQQQHIRQRFGALARMVALEQDPAKRRQMWPQVLRMHPNARGLDPSFMDPDNGPRLLMAEAGLVDDPLDRQTAQAKLGLMGAQTDQAQAHADYYRAQATQSGQRVATTPGQQAADKEFAKEYVDWQARGGYADVQKQTDQLNTVLGALESGRELTGPVVGSVPDWLAALAPEGRERIATRELVEEVVQRNLRLILGAQFTEREGERLIARAFNPRLKPEENATRVRRLLTQIQAAAAAKQSATEYFEQNGTLTGWQGKIPQLSDFDPESGGQSPAPSAPSQAAPVRARNPQTGEVIEWDGQQWRPVQ